MSEREQQASTGGPSGSDDLPAPGEPSGTEVSWTPDLIPDLTGRTAIVTGANSGIGFVTARELVRHGCHVVLACRDIGRGEQAWGRLREHVSPTATGGSAVPEPGIAQVRALDLADLTSVRAFAAEVLDGPQALARLDLLVNNAGVMALPQRTSADGFELQLATNHLGPFALTGLLLPLLARGELVGGPARVVTVSSLMHRSGRLSRDDLMLHHGYSPYTAYSQSKLANLLFMAELERRAQAAAGPGGPGGPVGSGRPPLTSLASHPGYAATNLQAAGPAMTGSRWTARAMSLGNRLLAQSAEHGAWPSLRAATDPAARGGQFYGPGRLGGTRGRPVPVTPSAAARDDADAAWLWQRSVELTGVDYHELTAAPSA